METTCLCCMIIIIFISQKENGKPFNKQMKRNIRHTPPPPHRPLEREYKHISNMNSHGYICFLKNKHKQAKKRELESYIYIEEGKL